MRKDAEKHDYASWCKRPLAAINSPVTVINPTEWKSHHRSGPSFLHAKEMRS